MKLTGAGAAGAAVGAGSLTGPAAAAPDERFIALSDSIRLALNSTSPGSGGIELTDTITAEDIRIDGEMTNGTWSMINFVSPDLMNAGIDFLEDISANSDLQTLLEEVVSAGDLEDLDTTIADILRQVDVRQLLGSIDTEALFANIVTILEGLDLPSDSERANNGGGPRDGAGRQILNELGYVIGLQSGLEQVLVDAANKLAEQGSDENLQFRPYNNKTTSGFLENQDLWGNVNPDQFLAGEKCPAASTRNDQDDDGQSWDSGVNGLPNFSQDASFDAGPDALLTNPSVAKFTNLFDRIRYALDIAVINRTAQGPNVEDSIQLVNGDDFTDLETTPRLDRIADLGIALLTSEQLSSLTGSGGGNNPSISGPTNVAEGQAIIVDYEYTNNSGGSQTFDVTFNVDGTTITSETGVTVADGETVSGSYGYLTDSNDTGNQLTAEIVLSGDVSSTLSQNVNVASTAYTCTGNGPTEVTDYETDSTGDLPRNTKPGALQQIENYLENELGFPAGFFDAQALEDAFSGVADGVNFPSLDSSLTTDNSSFNSGYVGNFTQVVQDLADAFDPTVDTSGDGTATGIVSEVPNAIGQSIDISALDGQQNFEDLKTLLRDKLTIEISFDTDGDGTDETSASGDLDLANETFTASISKDANGDRWTTNATTTYSVDNGTAQLIGDAFNIFLNNQITVNNPGDTPPQVIAKGIEADSQKIDFTSTEISNFSTVWDVANAALADLDQADSIYSTLVGAAESVIGPVFGDNNNDTTTNKNFFDQLRDAIDGAFASDDTFLGIPLRSTLKDLVTAIEDDLNAKNLDLVNLFDDDPSTSTTGGLPNWETNFDWTVTSNTSNNLSGTFNWDEPRGIAETLLTVDNNINLNLSELVGIITGDDGNSIGLNDLSIINQISQLNLADQGWTLNGDVYGQLGSDGTNWQQEAAQSIDKFVAGSFGNLTGDWRDSTTLACSYEWGDDTDGTNSPVAWLEDTVNNLPSADVEFNGLKCSGSCRISDCPGTGPNYKANGGNVTFIGDGNNAPRHTYTNFQEFIDYELDTATSYIDNNGGVTDLLANTNNDGLLDALNNAPYGPNTPPAQFLKNRVIELLNNLFDTANDGNGFFRDYAGAHAIEFQFTYVRRPPTLAGGDDLPDLLVEDGNPLLINVRGDVDSNGNDIIDISDTTTLVSNLDSTDVQNAPAVFNFSQFSRDDEVSILDCAAHWRKYIYSP